MSKTRVLVVDDSSVIRRIVSEMLSADAGIEVAGTASNGKIALSKIVQLNPDLVTLDVEMPEMDGLETIREIRKRWPKLPILMFSTLTERGASTTLDALALGATDYVTKPTPSEGGEAVRNRVREELLAKVRALAPAAQSSEKVTAPPPRVIRLDSARRKNSAQAPVQVVAVGVSTGGPSALDTLIPALPKDLPVPVVLVQHMPPLFTRLLAERLDQRSQLRVAEAVSGQPLKPGTVWIAPGDNHMTVEGVPWTARIGTNRDQPENSCRPAVDVLFRSVAKVFGAGTLAIVLTGMGSDGLRGCEGIREIGGQIVIQDKESSVVWGMPGAVYQAGLADEVVPLNSMADAIGRRVFRNSSTSAIPKSLMV
jgi:two-component system, chemotaxis family, protein-glutamate methylesterase/glutaminase